MLCSLQSLTAFGGKRLRGRHILQYRMFCLRSKHLAGQIHILDAAQLALLPQQYYCLCADGAGQHAIGFQSAVCLGYGHMNCGQGAFFCFRQFENLRERRAVVQYAHSIILLHGKTVQYRFTFHDDSAMHGAALGYLHRAVGVQKGQLRCIRKLYVVQYCHRITAYLLQQRYALQMAQAFYAVQFDRFCHVALCFAIAFG